ncbi:MAG: Trk system potassium transporter TrkA [Phycisphaeraceae bacterium]|nr:Trk system potassium transporter TrkA [Phycisphaeraceae bacterium]
MNVVICGAGEVGRYAAEVLGAAGNNITIFDRQARRLRAIEETLDVRSLVGNGAHAQVLMDAGCAEADVYLAATNSDEINLLSASIAAGIGAGRVIARVNHSAYAESRGLNYAQHLGIDHLVCPVYTTAVAIAQTLRNPGAMAVERFANGRIEMQQLAVAENAKGIGKPLASVGLPDAVRVATIERDGRASIPDGTAHVESGDIITMVGDVKSFEQALSLFHTEQARRKRVMIMGGTAMGVWLCRQMRGRSFSVRLFEPDPERSVELSEKLPWVTVIRASATDSGQLEEEHIEQASAFVALTDDDEHNILASARAKSLGAKRAIAVLQRQTYLHLLEHVGIDRAFSPRQTAVSEIAYLLRREPVRHLATLAEGVADVYEVQVTRNAKKVVGIPLRDVRLSDRIIIAAIQRGDDVFVPGGDDAIAAGDTVVMIGAARLEPRLKKTFVG